MSEQFKDGDFLPSGPGEQDVMALLRKIQQQLVFLEKKIDNLAGQPQERPFRPKHFSKSFRSFGHHRRHQRDNDNSSGEKRFERPGNFEKDYGRQKKRFGRKQESGDTFQQGSSNQERRFEKRNGREDREVDRKKKPFFYGRKGQR
ncbi:MAG: hypothetical protein COV72_01760 [Candidatus Omnitrophica bacterium CG11_big_fil_rev_8_21_14_0_20_42_13]|uniref:Uncharacterized protein n=1 Tax=Candidatus Ghiorseimicrobium undicola TaxID=1974746 RepID=A0A2H0M168_9BACT|nr:MAG: hypothetical protein COV72_01760 [Candidatus Omnitrophica bacterium CG11_big_fil_rev_8_21_14_0_20_42_13]